MVYAKCTRKNYGIWTSSLPIFTFAWTAHPYCWILALRDKRSMSFSRSCRLVAPLDLRRLNKYFDRKLLGPWSDVYSVGATMCACLVHAAPMSADQRLKKDLLIPAEKVDENIYSKNLLKIIDSCLALDHLQRPQSLFALQKTLLEDLPLEDEKPSLLNKLKDYLQK